MKRPLDSNTLQGREKRSKRPHNLSAVVNQTID